MNSVEGTSTIFIERKRPLEPASAYRYPEETVAQAICRTAKSCALAIAVTVMLLCYGCLGIVLADRLGAPLPTGIDSLLTNLEWKAWTSAKEAEYQTTGWRVIQ